MLWRFLVLRQGLTVPNDLLYGLIFRMESFILLFASQSTLDVG